MEMMLEFSIQLLNAVADFLRTEPMFYLFAIVLFLGIIKIFRVFFPFGK